MILLTARADEVDRVVGLELGADDYVVKPFSPRELAVRVRNMLRRTAASRRSRTGAGRLTSRPAPACASTRRHARSTVDGRAGGAHAEGVRPAADARRVRRGRCSRAASCSSEVWDSAPEYQDPATVTVHIGRLRQKMRGRSRAPALDHHGVGRRLPVRAVSRRRRGRRDQRAPAGDGGRRGRCSPPAPSAPGWRCAPDLADARRCARPVLAITLVVARHRRGASRWRSPRLMVLDADQAALGARGAGRHRRAGGGARRRGLAPARARRRSVWSRRCAGSRPATGRRAPAWSAATSSATSPAPSTS